MTRDSDLPFPVGLLLASISCLRTIYALRSCDDLQCHGRGLIQFLDETVPVSIDIRYPSSYFLLECYDSINLNSWIILRTLPLFPVPVLRRILIFVSLLI